MPAQLPLVPSVPSYRFRTTNYVVDVRWNGRDQAWYVDLYDEDEDPIRIGMKMVLGAFPGARVVDPRFPSGILVVVDTSGEFRDAGLDDLGGRVIVYFYSGREILAAAGVAAGSASAT